MTGKQRQSPTAQGPRTINDNDRGRISVSKTVHRLLVAIFLSSYLLLTPQHAEASILPSPSFGTRFSRRSFQHSSDNKPSNSDALSKNNLCLEVKQSKTSKSKRASSSMPPTPGPLYFLKVALAGGIAGGVGTSALYPMDAAKTLRQSTPSEYKSVFHALGHLVRTKTSTGAVTWHLERVYRGVLPAALGAIPSSALYFGAYEGMKSLLKLHYPLEGEGTAVKGVKVRKNVFQNRLLVHALAAMSGNVLSSAVFVPKELIKQQLQYRQSGNVLGVVVDVLATKGLSGMYVGYKATLLRNIPTAVLRFSLYEEFRYRMTKTDNPEPTVSPKFFLAGAAAGVLASGVMTPVDVLKTRLATGTCPVDVRSCFLWVIQEEGIAGLYSGAGSRMFFSGAFSAIGFGTFEWAKGVLGVKKPIANGKAVASSKYGKKAIKGNSKLPNNVSGKSQKPPSKILLTVQQ